MNSLTESQQALLNQKKVELRVKNEKYLVSQPHHAALCGPPPAC